MRILLPPSEGKSQPIAGAALDLDRLGFPALRGARRQVLDALVALCRSDGAAEVLRLGPAQRGDIERNADLRRSPTAPAGEVYRGVLFGALDLPTVANPERLLIASALFGLLRHDDPIPYYRLPPTVRLPGLPPPKRLWGPPLGEVLDELAEEHLLIDLRSSPYNGWHRAGVAVRVMTEQGGKRVTVGHHNKAAKGLLARDLAAAPDLGGADEVARWLAGRGWRADTPDPRIVEVLHHPSAA